MSHRKSIRDEKQSAKTLIKVDRRAADKFFDEPSSLGLHKFATGAVPQLPHHHGPGPRDVALPLGHKHVQFIAHLPTKYHPIPGQKGAHLMELAATGSPQIRNEWPGWMGPWA